MSAPTAKIREKLGGHAPHSKQSLRLWLKLLSCTTVGEKMIRNRLAKDFETTLPRFDVLSALERSQDGLTMGELSSQLLVSNGNVTGLVSRLQDDDMVAREALENDRRTFKVKLTQKGRKAFTRMAETHEEWVDDMFGDLTDEEISLLLSLLLRAQESIHKHVDQDSQS